MKKKKKKVSINTDQCRQLQRRFHPSQWDKSPNTNYNRVESRLTARPSSELTRGWQWLNRLFVVSASRGFRLRHCGSLEWETISKSCITWWKLRNLRNIAFCECQSVLYLQIKKKWGAKLKWRERLEQRVFITEPNSKFRHEGDISSCEMKMWRVNFPPL